MDFVIKVVSSSLYFVSVSMKKKVNECVLSLSIRVSLSLYLCVYQWRRKKNIPPPEKKEKSFLSVFVYWLKGIKNVRVGVSEVGRVGYKIKFVGIRLGIY